MPPPPDEQKDKNGQRPRKKVKMTPLPMKQMIPMTIVLMSESICQCMITPFAGYYVAYLQGVSLDEAGYMTGILASCFMLGQVTSAKMWGRVSDIYGRKFPLLMGLFATGMFMLGFGISTNVWMAAVFRFMQGIGNGNILVAKTMMADITDKTNEAVGFSFVSFSYGIGVLIGSALGGYLYEPHWFGDSGVFIKYPALMPSLFIFCYTSVGITVCTLFVMESNLKAKPLPPFLKTICPCMMYETPFYHKPAPPVSDEDDSDTLGDDDGGENRVSRRGTPRHPRRSSRSVQESSTEASSSDDDLADVVSNLSVTFPVGGITGGPSVAGALLQHEVRRLDRKMLREAIRADLEEELPSLSRAHTPKGLARSGRPTPAPTPMHTPHPGVAPPPAAPSVIRRQDDDSIGDGVRLDDLPIVTGVGGALGGIDAVSLVNSFASVRTASSHGAATAASQHRSDNGTSSGAFGDGAAQPQPLHGTGAPPLQAASSAVVVAAEPAVLKSFGYVQAFSVPRTRFTLLVLMGLCAADTCLQEAFPLWCMASVSKGGAGLSHHTVGMLLLTNSVPCIVANLCFPTACRHWNNKVGLLRFGSGLVSLACIALPLSTSGIFGTFPYWMFIAWAVACLAWRQFFMSWCYALITMLTARAAPPGHVGSLLGINQSSGALTRGVTPLIADPLFAWSISGNHIFPFNYFLLFIMSGGIFFTTSACTYLYRTNENGLIERVKSRKQRQREEEEEEEERRRHNAE